jgi:glycosyltransferase involved in cell wall biosynthesis
VRQRIAPVKVLHFSALDNRTGAGIAAARIHEGLLAAGVHSRFCVAHLAANLPQSFTPPVTFLRRVRRAIEQRLDKRLLRGHMNGYDYVLSTGLFGIDMARIVAAEQPDVVQLHWIAGGSFRLPSLARIKVPVVWRLSDQWPFCGLQHLEPDPEKYVRAPRRGPGFVMLSTDLSEYVRKVKTRTYRRTASLTLACPSRWIMAEAGRSALLGGVPLERIPTSCDTSVFALQDRAACRAALGLRADEPIILVGATSMGTRLKGGDLFHAALATLAGRGLRNLRVVTFGVDVSDPPGVAVTHVGAVRDRRHMARLYAAADVFVAPSRMENLSNAVLEALASGTPTAAFDIGGMPDMIDHQVNGTLAKPFDTEALADGIAWLLQRRGDETIRDAARAKVVADFSREQEMRRYLSLYRRLLSEGATP